MPCKNHPFVEDPLLRCVRCGESFCADCIVRIGGYPYCADCKEEAMRDLRSGLPAHEVRPLEMASIGRRFLALWVDQFLVALPLVAIFFAVAAAEGLFKKGAPNDSTPVFALLQGGLSLGWIGVGILYEGLMLASSGQTLGKKILKIKVVTPEGGAITKSQAWSRAVVRQVMGFVPCLGLVDYLVAFGQERTCIHDQAARTRVVDWNV